MGSVDGQEVGLIFTMEDAKRIHAAGEDEPLNSGFLCGYQNVPGTQYIRPEHRHLFVLQPVLHGSKMQDRIAAMDALPHRVEILHVVAITDIKADHLMAVGTEVLCGLPADKAAVARYEDLQLGPTFLLSYRTVIPS